MLSHVHRERIHAQRCTQMALLDQKLFRQRRLRGWKRTTIRRSTLAAEAYCRRFCPLACQDFGRQTKSHKVSTPLLYSDMAPPPTIPIQMTGRRETSVSKPPCRRGGSRIAKLAPSQAVRRSKRLEEQERERIIAAQCYQHSHLPSPETEEPFRVCEELETCVDVAKAFTGFKKET